MDWKELLYDADKVASHEEKFGGSGTMYMLRGADLAAALRQREADTIRRCIEIAKDNKGNGSGFSESYASGYDAACEDFETDLRALLPESAQ